MPTNTTSIALAITRMPDQQNLRALVARVAQECEVTVTESSIKKDQVLILSGPSSKIPRARRLLQKYIIEIGGMLQLR